MLRQPRKTTWQLMLVKHSKRQKYCFHHRHGEATGKPETFDTLSNRCIKMSMFRAKLPSNFPSVHLHKSMFSQEFSYEPRNLLPQNRSPRDAGFLTIFITSRKMTPATEFAPCRHLTIRKTHATGHVQSAAPATKFATYLAENVAKVAAPATQNDFRQVTKTSECHQVPRLPRETKQCHMFETSKNDPFCRTYHRHGHTALMRTVADGCERLRTVKRNVERTHPQPPDPQSETGTLATHSGKTSMHPCPAVGRC